MSSKDLVAAFAEASAQADAEILIENQSSAGASVGRQGALTLQVESRGPIPAGRAALLLAHDPSHELIVTSPENPGGLFALPVPTGFPPIQLRYEGNTGFEMRPLAFYRGRSFTSGEDIHAVPPEKLVNVEIRQYLTKVRVRNKRGRDQILEFPDQFANNSRRIYLHPYNWLDYELAVSNTTDAPLDLFVSRHLGDPGVGLPDESRFTLAGHAEQMIVGTILGADLTYEKPKILTINVKEEDEEGPALCKPLKVEVRKLHPKEFIYADAGYDGWNFFVYVKHIADPVSVPSYVYVRVEPAGAFLEYRDRPAVQMVPANGERVFAFQIIKPVNIIHWTVVAEGEEVKQDDMIMNEVEKKKAEEPKTPIPNF